MRIILQDIEERPKKVSDGAGGLVDITIKFPIWFDAAASGGTPMTAAFVKANEVISAWLTEHPDCFPPIVIHITDGDPTEEMKKLTEKISSDGNVILFNLRTHSQGTNPITFPNAEVSLPDKCAEILFNGASFLPEFMRNTAAKEYNLNLFNSAKAFVMNGDLDITITAIEIGTRPSLQLR